MMKEYSIETIFWEDHLFVSRETIPKEPNNLIVLTLSVGLVIEETDKVIVLAHDIERYDDYDDSTYTVILKGAIVGRKIYGKIEIEEPRR